MNALNNAVEFIENNNLKEPDRLDHITDILGAFVFIGEKEINQKQKEYMTKWYNTVEFANKDNGERRKIFDDLIRGVVEL